MPPNIWNFTSPLMNLSSSNRSHSFDGNTNLSHEEILGSTLNTLYLILRGLQGFFAIAGNLLTIVAVCKYNFLWEKCTARFVVSLACADLAGGVGIFVRIARTIVTTDTSPGIQLCYVELFLNLLSGYGNIYNILFVTIDRYVYITKALRYHSIVTQCRANVAIIILWCVNILQTILQLSFALLVSVNEQCTMRSVMPIAIPQALMATFCVILPCNVKIMLTVNRMNQTEPHLSCYPPELQAQQREKLKQRKMAKTMAYVLIPFLVCYYGPITFALVRNKLLHMDQMSFQYVVGTKISTLIFWVQCTINPFVYGWKNLEFRKAYKKLLCSKQNSVEQL